jgi:hypothetical protein
MSGKNSISENSHIFLVKFENQKLGLFYLKKKKNILFLNQKI